ncbi:MAG TPA: ABC transporter permease [Candidatus Cryosericum sp.]|jgi:peptide/nickel transport system permease protein|nr:ABC transporter permease [Candidatus Cryosericum sp.]
MAEQAVAAKKKQKTSDDYSYVGMVFHRLTRHKLAMAGAVMLILMMLFVFVGPLVWRADPNEQISGLEGMFNPPSSAHPLGTDDYGRDVLARMFFGGRISLFIGFVSAVSATLIGAFIGLLAGYYGGWADNLLMRFTDAMLSIPTFPLLIALASVMGKGMWQIIMVIVVFGWMSDARLVRGLALSLKEQEYVEAARAIGASANRIMWRHLFPNTLAVLIVSTTIGIGSSIIYEASISFLGFGIQAPLASWGNMLQNAQQFIWNAPRLIVYPGLAIFITVLGFNFFGDGLRDAIDPKLKL